MLYWTQQSLYSQFPVFSEWDSAYVWLPMDAKGKIGMLQCLPPSDGPPREGGVPIANDSWLGKEMGAEGEEAVREPAAQKADAIQAGYIQKMKMSNEAHQSVWLV